MTSIEEHKKKITEHIDEINDAINEGIEKKPVTIGFHCSACAIQLLEMYLHKINKIPIGKVIKHDWFKRPKIGQKIEPLIERKLNVDFPDKKEIYDIIYQIEENRTSLMYGSPTKDKISKIINDFQKLKEIFSILLKNEIKL